MTSSTSIRCSAAPRREDADERGRAGCAAPLMAGAGVDVRRRTEIDHPFLQPLRRAARKMQASKEVWGHLFGSIDSREKFTDHRLELALHEWARFKANDSLECRNCHSAQSMDITRQSPRAAVAHQRFLFDGEKTCIDCHKGIAHHLPDMRGVPGWQ
jgi:nitrate/TMAO reductase-like tetraheme cytochrome c subunit